MLLGRRARECSVWLAALGVAVLGACGGGGGTPADAGVDVGIDTPAGMCGASAFFTGDIVDWDATDARFCGVFKATVTVRGQPTQISQTNPNGRFELCVAHQAQTVADVAYSATPSECTTPKEAYPIPAVLVVGQGTIDAGVLFRARAMTPTRQTTMFTQVGQAYNPALGQLMVHIAASPTAVLPAVSIDASHATTQRFDGAGWQPGETGSDVFFPNVAVGATQVRAGNAADVASVTLEAGRYTYLTMYPVLTAHAD